MNTQAFVDKLYKFRGRYKEIAEEAEVSYDTVRKYAQGVIPSKGSEAMDRIAEWMKGRRP
jgi:hypothetical protein